MGRVHGQHLDLEGGDGKRQGDAVLVVVLLDGGRHGPADPYAVAAHHHEPVLPFLVQKGRVHGLAVFRPQLEYVADLDAPRCRETACAPRAGVAGARDLQVVVSFDLEVGRIHVR